MSRHAKRHIFRRFCLELLEDRRVPAVLTVNTTADDTTADSTLSLREAIELVDGTLALSALSTQEKALVTGSLSSTPDTIQFNIPGSGVQTIAPASALPAITVPVTIDGYSQPGASPNTLATGDNAVLLIQLSGANAGQNASGLTINGGQSVVRGLIINGFGAAGQGDQTSASAIVVNQAGGNRITGNFLGVDPTGTTAPSNVHDGIDLLGSSFNTIGGTAPADRNLIGGFRGAGIAVLPSAGQTPSGNLIEGNFLGTDRSGTKILAQPNSIGQSFGVLLNNAVQTTIGGTSAGAGNLISGGFGSGIAIQGSSLGTVAAAVPGYNLVEGNKLGADVSGTQAIRNNVDITIQDSIGNTIGGTAAGAANLISGAYTGVSIGSITGDLLRNQVVANLIGTDITGKPDLGDMVGIEITSSGNTIGGYDRSEGNVIVVPAGAGNRPVAFDVEIQSPSTSPLPSPVGNVILSNAIYEDPSSGIDYTTTNPGTSIGVSSSSTTAQTTGVSGRLVGEPNTFYTLQFFTSTTASNSSGTQPLLLLGSATVSTDATGQLTFHVTLNQAAPSGSWITATATGGTANTSMFAAPLQVGAVRKIVPADFQGTGKSLPAVFDPSTTQWYVSQTSAGQFLLTFFGAPGIDVPAPGDYDASGRTEQAVFRPSTDQWFVFSPNGGHLLATFGGAGDIPVPGDYDGVGYTEPAVFRPSTGDWFVLGPNGGHLLANFGGLNLTDIPAPADYDGVGHAEPAVFRPSTGDWFVLGANGGKSLGNFGGHNLTDLPVPGDYEGVGHAELAVFRPSTGDWFVLGSGGGKLLTTYGIPKPSQVPVIGPGSILALLASTTAQPSAAALSRSLSPSTSALSTTSPQSAPLLIPLVPSSDTASPLPALAQTSDRKRST